MNRNSSRKRRKKKAIETLFIRKGNTLVCFNGKKIAPAWFVNLNDRNEKKIKVKQTRV